MLLTLKRYAPALTAPAFLLPACSLILRSEPKNYTVDSNVEDDVPIDELNIEAEDDEQPVSDHGSENDTAHEETIIPCFPESCDGEDNDGDRNVDETCPTSTRFSDSNPAQGDYLDIITVHDEYLQCVDLRVQRSDLNIQISDIVKMYSRGEDNFYKWNWTLLLEEPGHYEFEFLKACDRGYSCPAGDYCTLDSDCGCDTDEQILTASIDVVPSDSRVEFWDNGEDDDGDGSVDEGGIESLRFSDRNPPAGSVIEVIATYSWGATCPYLYYLDELHNSDFILIRYLEADDEPGTYEFRSTCQRDCPGDCDCEPEIIKIADLEVGPSVTCSDL
jgi:hypothetical protein